jgi:hypothetical protein
MVFSCLSILRPVFPSSIMPFLSRPCGARTYYETKGCKTMGIPVLLGFRSCCLPRGGCAAPSPSGKCEMSPYNMWNVLPTIASENQSHFFVIGMDQHFANCSTGIVKKGDGWHTFLQDQLAVLDKLDILKCHILGSCISPSYAFQLLKHAPEPFGKCVMLQPIGLSKQTTKPGESWEGLNTDASRKCVA